MINDPQAMMNNYPQGMQNNTNQAPVLSVKSWLGTLLLLLIPIANIILLFVWAFSGNENPNKQNFAKAGLLTVAIALGAYLAFIIFIFVLIAAASQ